MGAYGISTYKQEQGIPPAGTPSRFGVDRFGLTFLNPRKPQEDAIQVTTGAAGTWSITVTNDQTNAEHTVTWVTAGATVAEAAQGLADAWNADFECLNVARATFDGTDTTTLVYRSDKFSYTSVVTPAGAGAETTTSTAESGFLVEHGAWCFRTLNADIPKPDDPTDLARTLINPNTPGTLASLAGIAMRPLNNENPGPDSTITYGHYKKGEDVAVMRNGRIWVPVAVDVKPGDPVSVIVSGTDPRPGWTTTGAGLDVSSVASFLGVAAAGSRAEVRINMI
jgi:hypothetical protein